MALFALHVYASIRRIYMHALSELLISHLNTPLTRPSFFDCSVNLARGSKKQTHTINFQDAGFSLDGHPAKHFHQVIPLSLSFVLVLVLSQPTLTRITNK